MGFGSWIVAIQDRYLIWWLFAAGARPKDRL